MVILLFDSIGAVALLPAQPLTGLPTPQVVWPVIITCNSSNPNASLDDCSIALTDEDLQSRLFLGITQSIAGFQCRKGNIIIMHNI